MKKNKWEKVVSVLLEDVKNLDIDKSLALFETCKAVFVKKYGTHALDLAGLSIKEDEKKQIDWDKISAIESLDFIVFSHLYENYLSQNRREKTGSFYTPYYITDYMIKKTLEIFLSRETGYAQEDLCGFFNGNHVLNRVVLENILKTIDKIRIIDIACGTGIFLIRCFEKILEYKKKIYEMLGKEVNHFMMRKYIVQNNLFGIDIQKEPVEITKMVLLSLIYKKDQVQDTDNIFLNIMIGDSLIDKNVFLQFPIKKVMEDEGGFDIVIGNPPYLGEKGNKAVFDKIRSTSFGAKYYEGKMDYFYFFIYKSLEILKQKGILSYITTNYFVTADGAEKLRDFLKNNATFIDIVNFNDYEIFKSAKGQHNIMFFLGKDIDDKQFVQIKCIKDKDMDMEEMYKYLCRNKKTRKKINHYKVANQEKLYDPTSGHILIQGNNLYDKILDKLYKNRQYTLGSLCNINQGIVSGADKVTKNMLEKKISLENAKRNNIKLNDGIFILSKEEADELGVFKSPYLKPMYKNSDIQRYCVNTNPNKYLLYIDDKCVLDCKILKHLSKYKEVLDKRREMICGSRPWYGLQWPRNQKMFENRKIIVPHRAKVNKFALNESSWYASADVYFITLKAKTIDWYFLLGLLNSKIMYFWLYNRGKRKGDYLELYSSPLKSLPIVCDNDENKCNEVRIFIKEMIRNGENQTTQEFVDQIFYDIYRLKKKEIQIIEDLHKQNIGK